MHNNVRIQGMYDATHELLHHTAVFEPQYLMDMVETFKERLPSDFYVKICALAKLYHDEKECLEKRLKTMRELFPAISETSSSTSEVIEDPYLHGLSSREVAERRQQTPLRPSIRGGIHSFEMRFHCGVYPIHESIFHCLCGKILYGNWQIQWQEHITSEVHTTWSRFFLDMTADVQLFHLNKKWDFSVLTESDARRYDVQEIDIPKSWILHYKGDYENEGENDVNEESRHEAEVELQFAESNN